MPKVAVVMAAYQAERTLERAIASVLAQTFADFELWVVDDGSTDRTLALGERFAEMDRRVRCLRLPQNQGAAAAMNEAWRRADAPLVAILDADDAALPDRLARQVAHLHSRPDVSVLGGAAHYVDERGRRLRTVVLPSQHEDLARMRWYRSPFIHPTVMMRRSFLIQTGGYTAGLRLGEDYDHWMRGFLYPEVKYENLLEPLVHYQARPVQRWTMIKASARVRVLAGRRESRLVRGYSSAMRILAEGLVEQSRLFAIRNSIQGSKRDDWVDPLREAGR